MKRQCIGLAAIIPMWMVAGICIGVTGIGLGTASAQAQTVIPGTVEPGRDRASPEAVPQGDFQINIPAPRRAAVRRSVDDLRFKVEAIDVTGVTAYANDVIRRKVQPLIGTEAALADVLALAEEIEAMYRADGFLLSRAFVPPQRATGGRFQINVVEGYVAAIKVEGGDQATRERITQALQPVLSARPLKGYLMERALLLANDLPGVQAAGLLRPSPDEPGASDLVVTIGQTSAAASLSADNRGSRYAGPWTSSLDGAFNSIFGQGEQLIYGLSTAYNPEERKALQLRYLQPVGSSGLMVSFGGNHSKSSPGLTLRRLDVKTESLSFGPRATYPIVRSRAFNLLLDGGLTFQESQTMVQSDLFSRDVWRVADIGATVSETGFMAGATSLTLGVAQGLDAFGAADSGSTPLSRRYGRPDFTKFTALARRAQALGDGFSMSFTAQGQWAMTPLLAGEQFAVGGRIGRGYDSGALTGDHGIGGSTELRFDERMEGFVRSMQPYTFYDIGSTWSRYGAGRQGDMLSSTGAGLRFTLEPSITASFEYAQTLTQLLANRGDSLPKRGYFEISYRF